VTVIATAGHVDHGKSSLVRALTGTDPDRLAEEKRRGMTIELGFAHTDDDGDGAALSFIDVPGHADLVRTMIAGVAAVEAVLLVIDAREGWMPQTIEHLAIVELLAIPVGVIALTKCDLVDDDRLAHLARDTTDILASSPIRWSTPVAVSTVTGNGIEECRRALSNAVGDVRAARTPATSMATSTSGAHKGRPRLFVDRVFTLPGAGTVVTGTLEHGRLHINDNVMIVRTGMRGRIRSLQRHGAVISECLPGHRCAINLANLSTDDIERGDALVLDGDWHLTDVVDVRIELARGIDEPPRPGSGHTVHFGTDRVEASLRPLAMPGLWRVRIPRAWPMTPGDRIVVRRTGDATTIGGGTVLDVAPLRRPSRARPDGSIESQLAAHGFLDADVARRLTGRDVAPVVGRWCAAAANLEAAVSRVSSALDDGEVALDSLEPWERDLVSMFDDERFADVRIEVGVARRGADPLASHPIADAIRNAGITGPATAGLDRDIVRRLVAAGLVLEHDGIAFHADTLASLAPIVAELLAAHPGGFTVSTLRERLGITRKHAVPLAACLDRAGWTLRRGDARIAGPRLGRGST